MSDAPAQFNSRRERVRHEQETAARLESEQFAAGFNPAQMSAPQQFTVAPTAFDGGEPGDVFGAPAENTFAGVSEFQQPVFELAAVEPAVFPATASDAEAGDVFGAPSTPQPLPTFDELLAEPTFANAEETATTSPLAFGAPKRREPKPVEAPASKGVNLFAAIAITATLSSVALLYISTTASLAPWLSLIAVPLAIVAIFLKGFNKIQSIAALVLALGFGGFSAYGLFLTAPEEEAAAPSAELFAPITVGGGGDGTADVTWLLEEAGKPPVEGFIEGAWTPFTLDLPAADPSSTVVTLTVNGAEASCSISLGGEKMVVAAADEFSVASCMLTPEMSAGS